MLARRQQAPDLDQMENLHHLRMSFLLDIGISSKVSDAAGERTRFEQRLFANW